MSQAASDKAANPSAAVPLGAAAATTVELPPAPPKRGYTVARFGKYDLLLDLGHGGMADVFLAVASGQVAAGFNKLVVVKRLRPNLADDPDFVAMLVDEARLAARLNHPNVVQTNEIGKVGRQYFIAMEYLDGQPLNKILTRSRKNGATFPLDLGLRILCDVLAGLHYAHELTDFDGSPLAIVHRDVSPQNVFVTYAGQVKIVDFGIAKAVGRSQETREGIVKGKVAYMAPEQAVGATVDRRADVFAAGVLLWDMAVGERMWKNVDELQVFRALVDGTGPRSPREKNPDVPEEVDRICRRALAPDPAERYATAAEFQADLEDYLRSKMAHASSREVSDFVSNLFGDKRTAVRKIIETQLAELRTRSASVPDLDEYGQLSAALEAPGSISADSLGSGRGGVVSPTMVAPLQADAAERTRAGRTRLLVVGLFTFVASLAVVLALSKQSPSTQTPSPIGSSNVAPSEVEGGEIRLSFKGTPSEVKFAIDDGPELENPYSSTVARDGSSHLLTARAPGYKSRSIEITYSSDVVLEVPLEREQEGAHAAKPEQGSHARAPGRRGGGRTTKKEPETPAPATAAPPPEPTQHRRAPRPIDTSITW